MEEHRPGAVRAGLARARQGLGRAARAAGEVASDVHQRHRDAMDVATQVCRHGEQDLEEACAAILVRCGRPLSVRDLRLELREGNPAYASPTVHHVSVPVLTDALRSHPAFSHDHHGWTVGTAVVPS